MDWLEEPQLSHQTGWDQKGREPSPSYCLVKVLLWGVIGVNFYSLYPHPTPTPAEQIKRGGPLIKLYYIIQIDYGIDMLTKS